MQRPVAVATFAEGVSWAVECRYEGKLRIARPGMWGKSGGLPLNWPADSVQ